MSAPRFDADRTHRRYLDRERSQERARAQADKAQGLVPHATESNRETGRGLAAYAKRRALRAAIHKLAA